MSDATWNNRNKNHVTLSERMAEKYDDSYATEIYQTRQYMAYEENLLLEAVSLLDEKKLAIELGCGTGRDLFTFSVQFDEAIGWDFSPSMVEVTTKKALKYGYTNVSVNVHDVEKEYFTGIKEDTVNFINAGFGMGSFIKDLDKFLAEAKKVMAVNGIFALSFYNKNSIQQLTNTQCFAAIPNIEQNTLTVSADGCNYVLPCISYTVQELKEIITPHFKVIKAITYPTISTMLSDEIISEAESAILELEKAVESCSWGHYIVIWCQKSS